MGNCIHLYYYQIIMSKTELEHYQLCQDHPNRRESKRSRKEQNYRNYLAYELRELRKDWDTWRELAQNLLKTEKYLESLEHLWRQKAWIELAQNLIREWQWKVLLRHLKNFKWLDTEIAVKLIEQDKWYEVCSNIRSFKDSDHRLIAEKLLEIWWHSELAWLLRNLQYFVWLDDDFSTRLLKKMIKSKFIESVDEYKMKENKWKFKAWDIKNIETWIKNRDIETATALINEWKNYIDKKDWESWEVCVNKNTNWYWLYCAKFALQLIKMLKNWDSMENIRTEIYNRWDSYNAFCFWIAPTVIRFSRRGKEFNEYIKSKL